MHHTAQEGGAGFQKCCGLDEYAEAEKRREVGRQLELWAVYVEEMLTEALAPARKTGQCQTNQLVNEHSGFFISDVAFYGLWQIIFATAWRAIVTDISG